MKQFTIKRTIGRGGERKVNIHWEKIEKKRKDYLSSAIFIDNCWALFTDINVQKVNWSFWKSHRKNTINEHCNFDQVNELQPYWMLQNESRMIDSFCLVIVWRNYSYMQITEKTKQKLRGKLSNLRRTERFKYY